jgi:hypothetical protein
VERERVVHRKVAASTFARGYLSGIVSSVFDGLQQSGFFYDPVRALACNNELVLFAFILLSPPQCCALVCLHGLMFCVRRH